MVRRKLSRVPEDSTKKKKSRKEKDDERSSDDCEEEEGSDNNGDLSSSDSKTSSEESMNTDITKRCRKKKKHSTWTISQEFHMCSLWKQNTFLYDPNDKNYHDTEKRRLIIEDIASTIKMKPKAVKKRMTTLRTVYGKILQMPDEEEKTARQIGYISLCSFLKPFIKTRQKPTDLAKERKLVDEEKTTAVVNDCKSLQSTSQTFSDTNIISAPSCSKLQQLEDQLSSKDLVQDEQPSSSITSFKDRSLDNQPTSSMTDRTGYSKITLTVTEMDSPSVAPVKNEKHSVSVTEAVPSMDCGKNKELSKIEMIPPSTLETDVPSSNIRGGEVSFLPSGEESLQKISMSTDPVEGQAQVDPIEIIGDSSEDNAMILWRKYMDMIKFNTHDWWARLMAEKLKLIQPKKAEELKVEMDTLVLKHLPDVF